MACEQRSGEFELDYGLARKSRADQAIVEELLRVLEPHPGGLRRWSVMRAIRTERERASLDISQKFEDEIERVFRRFCADYGDSKSRTCTASDALFHRPREKAGEVWAVHTERAKAWLAGSGPVEFGRESTAA
jgi:hypothetical protein